ncbi:alpha-L-arabinofuranosidase C-terminal domain-containing protein [Arachidicoccus soli]|nr:alpha-L-arabinofuranosidase C-terminal domain-containing protein [Arachidicoccus soli]
MNKKLWLMIAAFFHAAILIAQHASLTINASTLGNPVSATLHGAFFEEISHAGDGGLYAELIQNRGFEDATIPQGNTLEDGFLIPKRTPHFDMRNGGVSDWKLPWNVTSDYPGWYPVTGKNGGLTLSLSINHPLNTATPHNLKITISKPGMLAGVANTGYWGMNIIRGDTYLLSFYLWTDGSYGGEVKAALYSKDSAILGSHSFLTGRKAGWVKYSCTITAKKMDSHAHLVLSFSKKGTIYLDFVSLFPRNTYKNRPNGLRKDLAQYIANLHPAFIRWPGGCYVEGMNIQSAFDWKNTIGPIEKRPETYSPWGYWSTNGFGFDEYLRFCEDIGAKGLFVANVGVSCEMRSGTFIPDDSLQSYIQNALDAIEYATGSITSKWGNLRAHNGHPKPYPLEYIELGNEQSGPRYARRYNWFYNAIHTKYPNIHIIASMGLGDVNHYTLDSMQHVQIADEHAYKAAFWAMSNYNHFDKYRRDGYKVYVGEYATNGGVGRGNMNATLSDAVYILSMEHNGDLVSMSSYAPLLANVHDEDWPVNLINFDASKSYARISYYMIQMMAKSRADVNLKSKLLLQQDALKKRSIFDGGVGFATWDTQAEYKDLEVIQDGKTVYRSDFLNRPNEWAKVRGTWDIQDSALAETASGAQTLAYLKGRSFDTYTLNVKARKLSGTNAFIIPFAIKNSNTFLRAHIGSWVNSHCTFETVANGYDVSDLITQQRLPYPIVTGRWYNIRLEVMKDSVACYLDDKLIMTYKEPRKLFAIAGKDNKTGDIIIKMVNAYNTPYNMEVKTLNEHYINPRALMQVLSAPNGNVENSFKEPEKYIPITKTITNASKDFRIILPAYSVSVIRLKTVQ